jgi:phage terminase Nu1 subunit (DNA packaging protein)
VTAKTIPVGELADLLMLTEQRIRQLVQAGVIPRTGRGSYEMVPAVQGYIRYLKDRMVGPNSPAAGSIGDHKERLLKAKADQAEYDAGESAGRLLDRVKITHLVTSMIVRVKTKLLGIPVKAAPLVAVESEPEPCRAIIENLIHECLADLRSTDPSLDGVDWSGELRRGHVGGVEPAPEADSESVGGPEAEAEPGE